MDLLKPIENTGMQLTQWAYGNYTQRHANDQPTARKFAASFRKRQPNSLPARIYDSTYKGQKGKSNGKGKTSKGSSPIGKGGGKGGR